jgi:hypothetical protein
MRRPYFLSCEPLRSKPGRLAYVSKASRLAPLSATRHKSKPGRLAYVTKSGPGRLGLLCRVEFQVGPGDHLTGLWIQSLNADLFEDRLAFDLLTGNHLKALDRFALGVIAFSLDQRPAILCDPKTVLRTEGCTRTMEHVIVRTLFSPSYLAFFQ